MKILFSSYVFPPSVGGIENVGLELCKRMIQRGHEVVVITETDGPELVEDVPVIRKPSKTDIKELFEKCDTVFGNHLSLRLMGPLLFKPKKPHCVLLHTHLRKTFPHNLLMSIILRRGRTFAVSKHLAKAHNIKDKVIYNGYNSEIFHVENRDASRKFDFLFVGRLVSDKGIGDLVDAMNLLPSYFSCMVVGDGPDRADLEERAPENMKFLGRLESPYIAELMRQSKWVIVPSRWKEPFGLVAVEAIACGARVIAANHGGLPEAVGPCGLFFKPNNIRSLVVTMRTAMEREDIDGFTGQERKDHLSNFSYDKQVDSILQVLNR